MLRNLTDALLHPETVRKSTSDHPSNGCQEPSCRRGEAADSSPVNSLKDIWIQNENSRTGVPKRGYTMATVKEVLTLSQSVAKVMPVPLLQDAVGLALKIIQLCEVR